VGKSNHEFNKEEAGVLSDIYNEFEKKKAATSFLYFVATSQDLHFADFPHPTGYTHKQVMTG
jgi:hypothetical protein